MKLLDQEQKPNLSEKYTETGMINCKPKEPPLESNHKLQERVKNIYKNKERYQIMDGRLI